MHTLIVVADALVAKLNATDFSPSFTAYRRYLPREDVADLEELHVTVVPKSMEITGSTRAADQYDCQIDVAVQQKITPDDNDMADALMKLAQDIISAMRAWTFTVNGVTGQLAKTEHAPVYSVDHLERTGVVTSLITFTIAVLS